MSAPKILTFDIETAPLNSYHWALWDQNISLDQIKDEWSILAFCAKWVGKPGLVYADTGGKGIAKVRDDKPLLAKLWKLLDEADIVVAQNGIKFDLKKVNARLILAGYGPYSPVRVVDTLVAARKHFAFTSNKLAWTSQYLTNTPKSAHKKFPGFELWTECLKDNPAAWREMAKYNKRDVLATEALYFRLRPWIDSHPNIGAYSLVTSAKHVCPKCSSTKTQRRGVSVTQSYQYARFHCQACGGWSKGKDRIKLDMPHEHPTLQRRGA